MYFLSNFVSVFLVYHHQGILAKVTFGYDGILICSYVIV
jgi:hypothetical protein